MPLYRVELCYMVPHYVEVDVSAADAEAAQHRALRGLADALYDAFEPCPEASGATYVSECVEGAFDRVAYAPQDAHRPIHPDFRSDEQNTAEARDKLYALVELVANAQQVSGDVDTRVAVFNGLISAARELIGWVPESQG